MKDIIEYKEALKLLEDIVTIGSFTEYSLGVEYLIDPSICDIYPRENFSPLRVVVREKKVIKPTDLPSTVSLGLQKIYLTSDKANVVLDFKESSISVEDRDKIKNYNEIKRVISRFIKKYEGWVFDDNSLLEF